MNNVPTETSPRVATAKLGYVWTISLVAGIPHAQVSSPPIAFDHVDLDTNPLSGNQDEEYLRLNNPTDQATKRNSSNS